MIEEPKIDENKSEIQKKDLEIIQNLPNLKSLDACNETQSNFNENHQKINIQDDDKIQLHSQEAKQEQVTAPILKESELMHFTNKSVRENISDESQEFKSSQRKRDQKQNEKTYNKIIQNTQSNKVEKQSGSLYPESRSTIN